MPSSKKSKKEETDTKIAESANQNGPAPGQSKGAADTEQTKAQDVLSTADQATSKDAYLVKQSDGLRRTWYGGTWARTPTKAAPITELAKDIVPVNSEAVQGATGRAKSIAGSLKSVSRSPSISYMSPGASSKSLPITGNASKVHVSTPKLGATTSLDEMDVDERSKDAGVAVKSSADQITEESTPGNASSAVPEQSTQPGNLSTGWRGWIPSYRPTPEPPATPDSAAGANVFNSDRIKPASVGIKGLTEKNNENEVSKESKPSHSNTEELASRPRSWLGLWSGEQDAKGVNTSRTDNLKDKNLSSPEATDLPADEECTPEAQAAALSAATTSIDSTSITATGKARSWGFWPRNTSSATNENLTEQSTEAEPSSEPDKTFSPSTEALKSLSMSRKRERPNSSDVSDDVRGDKISKQSSDGKTSASAAIDILPTTTGDKPAPRKPTSANLLLPSLKQTLKAAENPGVISRLASYFYASKAPAKHVNLLKEPPKIKHALAIGVHGYFPAPFLRPVIGQPRGTSVRFATNAADAISQWAKKHHCNPKIDKIALEGEGRIEERVELLWQLLLKHIDKIQEADFILVACHSQGVPVAVQLVAKLINFGCLASTKVGICAMAGVNQGPFPEYKSRWIGGSAGELFDFANPDSKVSSDYETALDTVLKRGIKIVLVGSIDDQLVSMDSATFGLAEHPCLFRSVFINGAVHAPTFVVHLVGFALKLRNLGIPDHGLIRELSNSLAGSFTGDGHSRLYEELQLYDTAIEFTLETTPYRDVPLRLHKSSIAAASSSSSSASGSGSGSSGAVQQNPYILPFAMRGVLEEDVVRSELREEMVQLLRQFDDWKPTTKPLKDVKFRLEGVRSKI